MIIFDEVVTKYPLEEDEIILKSNGGLLEAYEYALSKNDLAIENLSPYYKSFLNPDKENEGDQALPNVPSDEDGLETGQDGNPILYNFNYQSCVSKIKVQDNVFVKFIHFYSRNNYGECIHLYVVCKKKNKDIIEKFMQQLIAEYAENLKRGKKMTTFPRGSITSCEAHPFDQMFINKNMKEIKNDLDFFLNNKIWFAENHLPYKRGYLFYGPPGTSKTMTIKGIISEYNMSICTFNFFDRDSDDEAFFEMFSYAAAKKPSIIILEDFNRIWGDEKDKKSEYNNKVSLSTVLNALDGVSLREGTIVIATANSVEQIDKALYGRPGRFDKIMLFDLPIKEERLEFLKKKMPSLISEECLNFLTEQTDKWNYSQLVSILIEAGRQAYEKRTNIDDAILKIAYKNVSKFKVAEKDFKSKSVGFGT